MIEPRFYSPATAYYTEGALVEAMKPDGLVRIHPYALIKLREDPALGAQARPEDRAVLRQLWRPSKVAAMTSEAIENQLCNIGVRYERTGFITLAKSSDSAWAIGASWYRDLGGRNPMHEDFLGLAASELWRRHCPGHPSLEMLDDLLCEGYALASQGKSIAAIEAWWALWEVLRSRLTSGMKTLGQAGESLFPRLSQCLTNWSNDFRMEAINSSMTIPACGEVGICFIRDLLGAFPGYESAYELHGDLAELYFNLKRNAEAEQCCHQLIRDYPDCAGGYVRLSDGFCRAAEHADDRTVLLERAVKALEAALAVPVKDADDFDVAFRLADARERLRKISSG